MRVSYDKALVEAVELVGLQLRNCAFNLGKMREHSPPHVTLERNTLMKLHDLSQQWDAAVRAMRDSARPVAKVKRRRVKA